jgi:RNA polymerase sigma factor (sigma-70 family)
MKPPPADITGDRASRLERLFLSNLAAIDRIAAVICARQGLPTSELEEFGSWVRLRIMENDYAMLRKFGGRASLGTYLTVVIANLFRDFRIRRRGRWRSSAAARRLGPVAERLERLVYAQRMMLREAIETVRGETGDTRSERELATLFARIPVRLPLRPQYAGEEALAHLPAESGTDAGIEAEAERSRREALRLCLERALDALPADDRLLLRLRYWEGLGVAEIARDLGLEPKPLYRRFDALLRALRRALTAEGVDAATVTASIGALEESGPDIGETRPSNREA